MSAVVKKYDDLIRCTNILTDGIESEFHRFVVQQEECRKLWLKSEQENLDVKQHHAKYKAEKETLEIKLKHARSQLETEMKKRLKAEQNVDRMNHNLQLIRELILDKEGLSNQDRERLAQSMTHFSSIQEDQEQSVNRQSLVNQSYTFDDESSILSLDEYDNTEDDILDETTGSMLTNDRRRSRKNKRRVTASAPLVTDETETDDQTMDEAAKRAKVHQEIDRTVETHLHVTRSSLSPKKSLQPTERLEKDFNRPPAAQGRRPPTRSHVQTSNSDLTDVTVNSYHIEGDPSTQSHIRVIQKQTSVPNIYPSIDSLISPDPKQKFNTVHGLPSNEKKRPGLGHSFSTKIAVRMELCTVCNKRVRFGSSVMKCRDCKVVCHPECKDLAPLQCEPTKDTPNKKKEGTIESYVPAKGLKVPQLVISCAEEIENRGLDKEQGLYRIPGNDKEVKELKEKFLRGKTPDLNKHLDIHAICGCLKDFLRNLSEPLITFGLHESFMVAATMADSEDSLSAMYQCVSELPPANRDTLAYLMVHLQKVASSSIVQMDVSNLAKCFGPTIVGHRSANPAHAEMLEDMKGQPIVIERLLTMPFDYWNQFLNAPAQVSKTPPYNPSYWQPGNTPKTPEQKAAPESRLGPLDGASVTRTNTQTPRFGTKGKEKKSGRNYFDSPH